MKGPLLLCLSLFGIALDLKAQNPVELIGWSHTWDCFHPMGWQRLRADNTVDADFGETWWLKAESFASRYDGVAFGASPPVWGVSAIPSSYTSFRGPGPMGYVSAFSIDYMLSPGAEFADFGSYLLPPPDSGNRGPAYFRTTFHVPMGVTLFAPKFRFLIDDGAMIWLDGRKLAAINMAVNGDSPESLALNQAPETALLMCPLARTGTFTPPMGVRMQVLTATPKLDSGEHTLAVAVHQSALTSNDLCFALQLLALPGELVPLSAHQPSPTQPEVRISWKSSSGKSYLVEQSSNLLEWTALSELIPATSSTSELTLPLTHDGRKFLRVWEIAE